MVKVTFILAFALLAFSGYGQFGFQRSTAINVVKMGENQDFPWAGGIDMGSFQISIKF